MKTNKYLIFRDDGVGDLLLITPVIKHIKKLDLKNKILLISSNRNHSYANLLKKSELIDEIYNIDDNKNLGRVLNLYYLFKRIVKFKPSISLIYRQKMHSYIISRILSKYVFGLVSINPSHLLRAKYRPFKFLIKFLLDDHELVDQRRNYQNISVDHWSDFYLNLYEKAYLKINNVAIKLTLDDKKYAHTQNRDLNQILKKSSLNISLNNNFILLHVDEKWESSKWTINDLDDFIIKLIHLHGDKIILTSGANDNEFLNFIYKKYLFKKLSCKDLNISTSPINEMRNVVIFDSIDIENLITISNKASLVITNHGSLTHFSSLNDVPVIDLITENKKYFLSKYYPKSTRYKQIELKSIDELLINVKEFI
tara:strand:+ start:200 stop:1303 length:1104 start_codon:yes stop_codon:yes gene_type:complete